jgi:hypothetical protein
MRVIRLQSGTGQGREALRACGQTLPFAGFGSSGKLTLPKIVAPTGAPGDLAKSLQPPSIVIMAVRLIPRLSGSRVHGASNHARDLMLGSLASLSSRGYYGGRPTAERVRLINRLFHPRRPLFFCLYLRHFALLAGTDGSPKRDAFVERIAVAVLRICYSLNFELLQVSVRAASRHAWGCSEVEPQAQHVRQGLMRG